MSIIALLSNISKSIIIFSSCNYRCHNGHHIRRIFKMSVGGIFLKCQSSDVHLSKHSQYKPSTPNNQQHHRQQLCNSFVTEQKISPPNWNFKQIWHIWNVLFWCDETLNYNFGQFIAISAKSADINTRPLPHHILKVSPDSKAPLPTLHLDWVRPE